MSETIKCPSCGYMALVRPFGEDSLDSDADVELVNGVFGCDTGCEYVRLEGECPECGDDFNVGDFGFFDDESGWKEELDYLRRKLEK